MTGASLSRKVACLTCLAAVAGQACGAESTFDSDARTKAHNGVEVRRVWVLSDPSGYASDVRRREIMVYELVCEQGKMTRVSEGFEAASSPKFGQGWVLRAQGALTPAAAQELLQHALADVCGI